MSRTISIVIVNKGDAKLADTLRGVSSISRPLKPEVVVVDSSSGRLDWLRRRYPDVKWIDYVHPRGKSRTIAEQRNVGVTESTGEIIVFIDASCVPADGWLEELMKPIEEDGESIVVGGVASRADEGSIHDVGRQHGGSVDGYLTECANMNVAISRTVLDAVGSFDEVLGFAEDVDFAWRAVDAGFAIRYAPVAKVAHEWGSFSQEMERALRYGIGRVRLYRKHRRRRRNLLGFDFFIVAYALYVLLLPLALLFPAYLLLLAIPVARNRRSRPIQTTAYHLVYGFGVASEFLHIPVSRSQARFDVAQAQVRSTRRRRA